jgi:hypothetical protein
MSSFPVPSWPQPAIRGWFLRHIQLGVDQQYSISSLAKLNPADLPGFVQASPVAVKYLRLLGSLDWDHLPERPDNRFSPDLRALPYAPFIAACLVRIDQHLPYMADLRDYLVENPALLWVLGFPLKPSRQYPWGFDAETSLPTHRHFSRLLRTIPDHSLQFLLNSSVTLIRDELAPMLGSDCRFGDCISLDTKHIIAWVKENNPKAYIHEGRYDKTKQPVGDPDCRLGCKGKTNQRKKHDAVESFPVPTPLKNPVPADNLEIGEYYWGYGSGVVATKIPDWGEFVLAELTQPFDQPDVSYFNPLMEQVEHCLGFKPRFGALDAAFDAFYVYEYFNNSGGFAAVPFVERGRRGKRLFDEEGAPFCQAGRPMTLKYTFLCKTTLIPHERGRYVCPLLHPTKTREIRRVEPVETCPIQHKNWEKGGCISTIATSPGARLRYQLDRESEAYKKVYKQRTATERINSQAVEFGIERPKLRNRVSITNQNTLTYILINLHALQRIRQRRRVELAETLAERGQAVSA